MSGAHPVAVPHVRTVLPVNCPTRAGRTDSARVPPHDMGLGATCGEKQKRKVFAAVVNPFIATIGEGPFFAMNAVRSARTLPYRSLSFVRTLTAFSLVVLSASFAMAWPGAAPRSRKLSVRFLAAGIFLRSFWTYNEDNYLAEALPSRGGGQPELIWLIDRYPGFDTPLSRDQLTAQTGSLLRLRRDPQCDRAYGGAVLHTAPGDPLAALPDRRRYQPILDVPAGPDTMLACYRTVRR